MLSRGFYSIGDDTKPLCEVWMTTNLSEQVEIDYKTAVLYLLLRFVSPIDQFSIT